MKKENILKINNYLVIFIVIVIFISIIKFSFGYEVNELNNGSFLIGNDIYEGYVGPNKLISSAINYYKESKDKEPLILYKYEGKNMEYETWSYLNENNEYAELSVDGIRKLELKRIIHNSKQKLDALTKEELILNSSYNSEDRYYFFDKDLLNLGIKFSGNIFGYIVYENQEIVYYNFFNENVRYDNYDTKKETFIKVSDYGAIADDGVDDTEAIKNAIEALTLNNGGVLYFEKGTYDVSVEDYFENATGTPYQIYTGLMSSNFAPLEMSGITGETIIDFNGSTIKLNKNSLPRYKILSIADCNNVIIVNGNLIGDRLEHDFSLHEDALGGYSQYINSHCWGHGISINRSNVIVDNVEISDVIGDLITLVDNKVSNVSNIKLYNVNIFNSRRMGITIEEINSLYVDNLYIHRIGDFDNIEGVAPKSGIDIESELTGIATNYIKFKNLKIENTTNYNIVCGKDEYINELFIENSYFDGKNTFPNAIISNSYFLMNNPNMTSTFRNSKIENSHFDIVENNDWLHFKNSTVNNSVLVGNYSDSMGNYLRITDSAIHNSTITRFRGYHEKYTNSNNTYTGIQIDSTIQENLDNNHFIDNFFVISGSDADYYFKNSSYQDNTFYFSNSSTNLEKRVYINNSYFKNNIVTSNSSRQNHKVIINMENSNLFNTSFGYFQNNILNSKIELFEISTYTNNIFDYESIITDSIIKLNSELNNSLILNNTLLKNTKVFLEKYNNDNLLSIKEGSTDYEIIYNGNLILKND